MESSQNPKVDCEVVSRALISLVADMTWAERQRSGATSLQRTREEAMSLLPKVQRGDHEAALRAMELVSAGGGRAA
jgi:hypothetical protein